MYKIFLFFFKFGSFFTKIYQKNHDSVCNTPLLGIGPFLHVDEESEPNPLRCSTGG